MTRYMYIECQDNPRCETRYLVSAVLTLSGKLVFPLPPKWSLRGFNKKWICPKHTEDLQQEQCDRIHNLQAAEIVEKVLA